MKLFGQVAQEPLTRCGRGGFPVVIGAVSPIIAGRGDGSIQGPLDAGVPALRGAGADAPGHAALGMGHIAILTGRHLPARLFAVLVPDYELHHSLLRIDGVARSGQQDNTDHAWSGDEVVVFETGRSRVVAEAIQVHPGRRAGCIGCRGALPVDAVPEVAAFIEVGRHAKVPKPVIAGYGMRHHVDRHALCALAGLDLDRHSAARNIALRNKGFIVHAMVVARIYPQTNLR